MAVFDALDERENANLLQLDSEISSPIASAALPIEPLINVIEDE